MAVLLVAADAEVTDPGFGALVLRKGARLRDLALVARQPVARSLMDRLRCREPYAEYFPDAEVSVVHSVNDHLLATLDPAAAPYILLLSVGLPDILRPPVLALAGRGALNVHNGTLPDFRGHFATFWEYKSGRRTGGVSIHVMKDLVDAGPVVQAEELDLDRRSLVRTILDKRRLAGALLAPAVDEALARDASADAVRCAGGDVMLGERTAHPWPTSGDFDAVHLVPLPRWRTRLVAFGLLILASPLVFAAAAWIRLVSGAPVLLRTKRIGRRGTPFEMWKLRTLEVRDMEDDHWADTVVKGDKRVIPGGQWLRSRKIDEIPQLWNVVKGDMTIVGPRPEMPSALSMYGAQDARILDILPGLTDLASLEYFDLAGTIGEVSDADAAYRETVFARRMALRHHYRDEQSPALDRKIALATLRQLIKVMARSTA
jgi:lipopolysaccharide/colanic/teichoic acid biosynthesis glycosyltransferase/folate-dependent phosphoribosylglycinamide formyltransferase PurN